MRKRWTIIFPERVRAAYIEARDDALLEYDEQYVGLLAGTRSASLADLYDEEVWVAYWETVAQCLDFADQQAQEDALAFAVKHLTN